MTRATVDTNILIWGVRGWAKPDQLPRIDQAKQLFAEFVAAKDDVVLTAQSVAEYLVGLNPLDRARTFETLSSRFEIVPFDANAATIAAELRDDKAFLKQLGEDLGRTQVCIKSDIAVVATAIAHQVDQIVSDDGGIRAIAERAKLSCRGLPEIAKGDGSSAGKAKENRILFPTEEE